MYKATLTYLAVVLALALCVAASSQTAETAPGSASSEPETEMGLPLEEGLEDFYFDDEELQNDEDQEVRELAKRALPKLRRIFIGKRGAEDSSNDRLFDAKRAYPRRHLFIGKRSGDRTKKGRVHRIFIG